MTGVDSGRQFQAPARSVVVDRTHMRRRASGIERITQELFSAEALAPLGVDGRESGSGRASMILHQMLINPAAALARPGAPWLFPGYPPSPVFSLLRDRTVLYVHDLFLMTRASDLNRAAKYYMAPPFRVAVRNLRYFLVNSATTGAHLAKHIRADAQILPYRPRVSNVFALDAAEKVRDDSAPVIVGALGTVEPRKNFGAAAEICLALSTKIGCPVELHIIGRSGWGADTDALSRLPHVRLHGFLDDTAARTVIRNFDLFLCTSHDEGLGLPLLEIQFAGLPVIAPDAPVFHEVLGESGTYIDASALDAAAAHLAALLQQTDWHKAAAGKAHANIERWNAQADRDRQNVVAFLMRLSDSVAGRT
jgi:glycosyltransferase involved in cell wall biosynthesis